MSLLDIFKGGKKVRLLGREYSESEWREALKSNKGIFKRINKIPESIAGPSLTASYDLTGAGFTMESMAIRYCTKEQQNAYEIILKQDVEKALEYLFTVTNSDIVWKKKIKALQNLLVKFESEEGYLLSEDSIVKKAEEMRGHLLDSEMEKHFPQDFEDLKKDINDLEKFSKDLEKATEHVELVKKKIQVHLAHLQSEVPFLFE